MFESCTAHHNRPQGNCFGTSSLQLYSRWQKNAAREHTGHTANSGWTGSKLWSPKMPFIVFLPNVTMSHCALYR